MPKGLIANAIFFDFFCDFMIFLRFFPEYSISGFPASKSLVAAGADMLALCLAHHCLCGTEFDCAGLRYDRIAYNHWL